MGDWFLIPAVAGGCLDVGSLSLGVLQELCNQDSCWEVLECLIVVLAPIPTFPQLGLLEAQWPPLILPRALLQGRLFFSFSPPVSIPKEDGASVSFLLFCQQHCQGRSSKQTFVFQRRRMGYFGRV